MVTGSSLSQLSILSSERIVRNAQTYVRGTRRGAGGQAIGDGFAEQGLR